MVANGKLIALDSAGSPIIQRMRAGEMPPPSAGLPALTEADIATVAQFIENPRVWPAYVPANCSSKNRLTTFDALFETITENLIAAADDAQFYRYQDGVRLL